MYQKFTSSEFQQKLSFMVIENVLLYLSVDSAINGLVWHLIMTGLTNFKFLTQKQTQSRLEVDSAAESKSSLSRVYGNPACTDALKTHKSSTNKTRWCLWRIIASDISCVSPNLRNPKMSQFFFSKDVRLCHQNSTICGQCILQKQFVGFFLT